MTPRQCVDTLCITLAACLATTLSQAAPAFERVLDKPCRALALDQEPYWAALGADVATVGDKKGVHEEKLPDGLRGADKELGIFFGRDYRIRIAGTAHTAKGDEARYYRSLPGGLRPAHDELGPLGKQGGPALLTLLGTTDPEIVCRAGMSCLIKTVKGWAKASAPSGLERVGLSIGGGWAIAGSLFFKLEKDWVALPAGPWKKASDGFRREDRACVVEHATSRMHHFDGSAWRSSASPVTGPRSLWGGAESMWIAGDGGASVFAEGAFQSVSGPKQVVQVLGRSETDVWLCSAQGVFRSKR
jgi:hypothetical protein